MRWYLGLGLPLGGVGGEAEDGGQGGRGGVVVAAGQQDLVSCTPNERLKHSKPTFLFYSIPSYLREKPGTLFYRGKAHWKVCFTAWIWSTLKVTAVHLHSIPIALDGPT